VNAAELAALRGEIAKLRATVDALTRVVGLFYHAGYDDALGHTPAAAPRAGKPRRSRSRPSEGGAVMTSRRPYRRRRVRVYLRLGCGPIGCSVPLLAALVAVVLVVMFA
jgi:hypothetical protein